MQPGTETDGLQSSDDIHAILERFSSWTGKQSRRNTATRGSGNEVREIAYDEAVRKYRAGGGVAAPAAGPPAARGTARTQAGSPPIHPQQSAEAAPVADTAATRGRRSRLEETAVPRAGEAAAVNRPAGRKRVRRVAATPAAVVAAAAGPETKTAKRRSTERPPGATSTRSAAAADAAKARTSARTEFRQVLALRVNGTAAERCSRITIRFSPQEEQRLRYAAKRRGVTVSAYLRERALAGTETECADHEATVRISAMHGATTSGESEQAPGRHGIGKWLAGFRQRWVPFPSR